MAATLSCPARWLALALPAALLAACASPPEPQGANRCAVREDAFQCSTQPLRALSMLPAGAMVTVRVDARCEWNPTGVILERGARYRIRVTKVLEDWADGWQRASDLRSGWPGMYAPGGRIVQRWSRAPDHPMYALIGAQGHGSRGYFVVGREAELTADIGDELLFFANDWPGRYHNNHGCLELEVQRQ